MRHLHKKHNMSGCRKTSMNGVTIPLLLYSLFSILIISSAVDTISKTQIVSDGQTIVSSDETFEMGFFSPGVSKNRYVGIWYKKISPGLVVWVANREIPLDDTLGLLKVVEPGILVLLNGTNDTIWSTNTSRTVQNPVVQLLDSGNLVVRDANDDRPDNFLWQGFDYPCDTLLPGMKFGKSLVTGKEWFISSWKSKDDPAKGDYATWLDLRGYPQFFISKGSVEQFRSGPWNGLQFSGGRNRNSTPIYHFGMYFERQEVFFRYDIYNSSIVTRMFLNSNGVVGRWTWVDRTRDWFLYNNEPTDNCDAYKLCGPYGSCDVNKSPVCRCLDKFVPRYPKDWEMTDWSRGCVRRIQLNCQNGDGFVKYSNIKLPDTRSSWYNVTMTLWECKEVCLKNCSCMAYTSLDIRGGGSGCLLWFEELVDIRQFSENGQDIYIRIASSDLEFPKQSPLPMDFPQKKSRGGTIVLGSSLGAFFGVCLLVGSCILIFKWKREPEELDDEFSVDNVPGMPTRFSYDDLKTATNDFNNKLGEGGFGSVFQGTLSDGTKVAVKRLDGLSHIKKSFLAEVETIGSIHHINLVRLTGFCSEKSHRLLVYEYMPNGSLDKWIFCQQPNLGWKSRNKIILDVAKGLAYLHEDCRQKIYHLDIKPQNILLDDHFNAKISDFGLSQLIDKDRSQVVTTMRGTVGYLAPEWLSSIITEKVDVYSFGVVLLEILCGRKNLDWSQPEEGNHLLSLFKRKAEEGLLLDLVDKHNDEMQLHGADVEEMMRVALWCLQGDFTRRPSMSVVVKVLEGFMDVETDLDYSFTSPMVPRTIATPAGHREGVVSSVTPQLPSTLSGPR